jgi:hypothetical protein
MVIVQDDSINYEASTLRSLSSKYNRVHHNTQICTNLHRMGGNKNTLTRICNHMLVPYLLRVQQNTPEYTNILKPAYKLG